MSPIPSSDPRATAWLAGLDAALQPLPAVQRQDLLREMAGHLAERAEQGRIDDALSALGSPNDFARPFVEDHDLTIALNRTNPAALLLGVLARAGRSLFAFAAGFVAVVLYLVALALAAIAMLKPITPNNVGLWRTAGGYDFGAIYGTIHSQPELFGYWIMPVGAIGAVIAYLAATEVLKLSGRAILRRSPRPALA
jgi:uncharacterized membrane protein